MTYLYVRSGYQVSTATSYLIYSLFKNARLIEKLDSTDKEPIDMDQS